jgi:hypothetical protein
MRRAVLALALLQLGACSSAPEQVASPAPATPPPTEATAACVVADRGARIQVTATNTASRPATCQVTCTFETAQGAIDSVACDGTVAAGANAAPFCEKVDRRRQVSKLTSTIVDCGFAPPG